MEILIVLAIIGAIVAIGVPKLANRKGQMRSEIQRIAVLSREIFNAARLQNRTFRLVFDLGINGARYYVESAAGQVQLLTEEQQKELDEKTSERREALAKQRDCEFPLPSAQACQDFVAAEH